MKKYGRILVIGRRGQVGWELRRTLAPLGELFAFDYPDIDLTKPETLRPLVREIKPDLVVNAAAYTAVDKAEDEVETCRAINAGAPRVLAEEAAALGAGFVHYSTDYVYNGRKDGRWVESDTPDPLSVYGLTKLEGDQAIAATGVQHLIFRLQWVWGTRGANFVKTMLKLSREREELKVIDDQVGAPTYSRHIAEASALAVARWQDQSGIYHLANGGETSWHGFAQAIFEDDPKRSEQIVKSCLPIPTSAYPTKATRPLNSRMDQSKLDRDFGIRMPHWRDALKDSFEE
ncbi:MAG TPA: dTDP-4-dehydrorhamnose reductase [Fibrobacteria bacterium]|nr:dTDP-4-dehydrorhamnose reductase [Fibrobacteria bacterium]